MTLPTRRIKPFAVTAILILVVIGNVMCAETKPAKTAARTTTQTRTPRLRGFGVATHFNRRSLGWKFEKLLPLMKQMGVSVVRNDIYWSATERQKGVYKMPAVTREWIQKAADADIKVITVLVYGNKLYDNPLDPDAFAKYAAFVARELKGKGVVAAYEIWNEPNNFRFRKKYGGMWNGSDNAPWISKFAELVQKTAAEIRTVDPDATIVTGGGTAPATVYLMRRHPEAFKNIDGLTLHPYTYHLPPETVPWGGKGIDKRDGVSVADANHSMTSLFRKLREYSRKNLGRELPIWVTEFGYTTFNHFARHAKRGLYAGFREPVQAAYHVRALVAALADGVKVWCIYDFMNDGRNPLSAEDQFGLVRNASEGYRPKSAFHAIRRVNRLLGTNWKVMGVPPAEWSVDISELTNKGIWQGSLRDPFVKIHGPRIYWFKVPDGYVTFIWKAGRYHGEFNSPLGKITWRKAGDFRSVEVTDMVTGERVTTSAKRKGQTYVLSALPVGASPIAVRWTFRKLHETRNDGQPTK